MMPTDRFSDYETRLVYSALIILILSIAAVGLAVIIKHQPIIIILTLPLLLYVILQLVHIYFQHHVLGSKMTKANNARHIYPNDVRKKWYFIFTVVSWLLVIVTILIFVMYFEQLDILLIILYIINILNSLLGWWNGRRVYYSDISL